MGRGITGSGGHLLEFDVTFFFYARIRVCSYWDTAISNRACRKVNFDIQGALVCLAVSWDSRFPDVSSTSDST